MHIIKEIKRLLFFSASPSPPRKLEVPMKLLELNNKKFMLKNY